MEWSRFSTLLLQFCKADSIEKTDVLFGDGLDLSSIRFAEFIMTLEEETGSDIDIDDLDVSVKTAGQLYARTIGQSRP